MNNGGETTRAKGADGESLAARELEKRGISIIERNFRSIFGEIDLVGLEQATGTLVFIEVKSWRSLPVGSLEQSISKKKQQRIIETAKYFLQKYRKYSGMTVRFDVVFIGQEGFNHIAAAFMENK